MAQDRARRAGPRPLEPAGWIVNHHRPRCDARERRFDRCLLSDRLRLPVVERSLPQRSGGAPHRDRPRSSCAGHGHLRSASTRKNASRSSRSAIQTRSTPAMRRSSRFSPRSRIGSGSVARRSSTISGGSYPPTMCSRIGRSDRDRLRSERATARFRCASSIRNAGHAAHRSIARSSLVISCWSQRPCRSSRVAYSLGVNCSRQPSISRTRAT